MRSGGTRNAAAYDAYLRGVALYDLAAGEESDRGALAQFESAIEIDASYAAAHAERARTLTAIANGSSDVDQLRTMYDSAIASAETAVSLAPDYADGHAALGYVLLNARLDVQAAARSYRRSYELGAGNADILAGFATFSFRNGQFDDAREAINTAIRLDPLNPYALRTAGNGEYAAGHYREAVAYFRQALELNTDLSGAHAAIGDALFMLGEHGQAREEYSLEPSALYRLKGLAICERLLNRESAAQTAMAELIAEFGDNGLYQQAQVLSVWGDRPAALAALERAQEVGDSGLVLARNDPMLNGLRDAPEFIALLRDIGFA
jgi:tetratricopeptide (TPR) repeat protein